MSAGVLRLLLCLLVCLVFIPGGVCHVSAETFPAEERVAGEEPEDQMFTVTLPLQMELSQGYSLTDGKAVYGTEILIRVKDYYLESNVKANGTALDGSAGVYNLTVTEDVTVTGDFEKLPLTVSYKDEENNLQTTKAYVLNGTEHTLEEGWYCVKEDVTFDHQVTLTGDVCLILGGNRTLTMSEAEQSCIYSANNSLRIYDENLDSNQTGRISIETPADNPCSPICLEGGNYTQNGGTVTVKGYHSITVGGNLTMNNGRLTVTLQEANKTGVTVGGEVFLNEGRVRITTSGEEAVGVESAGDILLGGAYVRCNRLFAAGSCRIADGLRYSDGTNVYDSSAESSELEALRNITLDSVHTVRIAESIKNGTVTADKAFVNDHASNRTVTLTFSSDSGSTVKSVSVNGDPLRPVGGRYSFEMPLKDVTITAEFTAFVGRSLSLNGTTDVNFYLSIGEEQVPKAVVIFAYGGREAFDAEPVYDSAKQLYKATCPVSAAYMTSDITATYFYDGEFIEENIYSVSRYAGDILENSVVYPAETSLIKAMLNYGANAQNYFHVNTETLANAGLTEEEKILGEVTIDHAYSSDLPESISFEGATLSLRSGTTLSLYFTGEETLEFSCEGRLVETQRTGGYQIARIRNIPASEVQEDFALCVKEGDNTYTVIYSPLNYIKNAIGSSKEALCNVAKALYFYSAAAVEYFSHWTVTFDGNGAEETIGPITVVRGESLTLPVPGEREDVYFDGWYTAAEGGTKAGDAAGSYLPSANTRLYARWKPKPQLSWEIAGGAVEVFVNNQKMESPGGVSPKTVVKIIISYDNAESASSDFNICANSDQTVNILTYYLDAACKESTTKMAAGTYYFIMPEADTTIYMPKNACVVKGTLITMADGTVKPVEQVQPGEELLVWNMETGRYDSSPVVFNHADPEREYRVLHVCFSDGTEVAVVYEQGFFDSTLGKYVYINENTWEDYISHQFIRQGDLRGNTWVTVTLTKVWTETKKTEVYSPGTFCHLCVYANGILSVAADTNALTNIFEVDPGVMAYDREKMQADIERYGLLTYEDFKDLIPEEIFYAFNAAWMNVSIGKGLITWEEIENITKNLAEYLK